MKYNSDEHDEPSNNIKEMITMWIQNTMQVFIDTVINEMQLTGFGIDAELLREQGCDHLTHLKHNVEALDETTVAVVALLGCGCLTWSHLVDFVKPCYKHSVDGSQQEQTAQFIRKHELKLLELFPEHYNLWSSNHNLMAQQIDEQNKLEELLKDVRLDL